MLKCILAAALLLSGSALAQTGPQTPPPSVVVNAGLAPTAAGLDGSNHLTLTYPGTAGTITGPVIPSSAAPVYQSTGPTGAGTTGQLAYATSTRVLYIYEGGAWVPMGSLAAVASGLAPALTGTSVTYGTGKFGTAMLAGSSATTPAVAVGSGSWSAEFWISAYGGGGSFQPTFSLQSTSDTFNFSEDGSAQFYLEIIQGGAGTNTYGSGVLAVSQSAWHHVALVYVASTKTYRVALDGVWYGPSLVGTDVTPSTLALTFGVNNAAFDEVRVSNVARYTPGTTFTPPSAVFVDDANTVAHYSLDGNLNPN